MLAESSSSLKREIFFAQPPKHKSSRDRWRRSGHQRAGTLGQHSRRRPIRIAEALTQLGLAPRRSALREDRRLARAESCRGSATFWMSIPKFFERKRAHVGETQSARLNKKVLFVTLQIGRTETNRDAKMLPLQQASPNRPSRVRRRFDSAG